jgi:hypothetical protein
VFSGYFGYEQRDIKGKSIAGADEHLLKALVRDTTGISYAPLPLIYDRSTGKPVESITVLPVDLSGNGKVSDDEKFYQELSSVLKRFEEATASSIRNVPVGYLHFSVEKKNTTPEALAFLAWVINNSTGDLHSFGYLNPEPGRLDKEKFGQFSLKKVKQ